MISFALLLVATSSTVAQVDTEGGAPGTALPHISTDDGFWRTAYGHLGTLDDSSDVAASASRFVQDLGPKLAPLENSTFDVTAVKNSLAMTHVGFEQRFDGIPVAGGGVSVHALHDGAVLVLHSRAVAALEPGEPQIPVAAAEVQAMRAAAGLVLSAREVLFADGILGRPAYEFHLASDAPFSRQIVYISQVTGEVLHVEDELRGYVAQGQIWTNPITEAEDPDLRDRSLTAGIPPVSPNPTLPNPATLMGPDFSQYYSGVNLLDLEAGPLGPMLRGPHALVVDGLAFGDDMVFERDDPRFEEVMAYYWVDASQRLIQSLGFDDVANFSVPLTLHTDPNSALGGAAGGCAGMFFGGSQAYLAFVGRGAAFRGTADAAEDADVIVHEYGHTIQCNQMMAPWPSYMLAEGWSDYWAATVMGRLVAPPYDTCVGEWIMSYGWTRGMGPIPCARNVRNDMEYSAESEGALPHFWGQVWSGALWNLRELYGAEAADQLALEANFLLPNDAGFREGAEALLVADFALTDAARAQSIVEEFARRNVTALRVSPELFEAAAAGVDPSPTGTRGAPAAPLAALVVALAGCVAFALRNRREG